MGIKDEIKKVLRMYKSGDYDTKTFCDIFIKLYYFDGSGSLCFKGKQREALDKLAIVVERFSAYDVDIKNYPNVYTSEKQVRSAFEDVLQDIFCNTGDGSLC